MVVGQAGMGFDIESAQWVWAVIFLGGGAFVVWTLALAAARRGTLPRVLLILLGMVMALVGTSHAATGWPMNPPDAVVAGGAFLLGILCLILARTSKGSLS
jgi:hypothetical protein